MFLIAQISCPSHCTIPIVGSSVNTYMQFRTSHCGEAGSDSDTVYNWDFDDESTRWPLLDALVYSFYVADFLGNIAQVLLFLAITAFSLFLLNATHQSGATSSSASRLEYLAAFLLAALLAAVATAAFSMACYSAYIEYSDRYTSGLSDQVSLVTAALQLSYESIMSAGAVFPVGLAISARARNKSVGGKDDASLLTIWAGIFLLLSALYLLTADVHFTWLLSGLYESPAYYRGILIVLLRTWPMLGAILVLYVALKKWYTGAAGNQARHEAEEAVLA
ncbi:hypothetical protein PWT90_08979 [Aphanocladium album]|nr:hypothetical protein PWT90_08979 [Aphanocladium album]